MRAQGPGQSTRSCGVGDLGCSSRLSAPPLCLCHRFSACNSLQMTAKQPVNTPGRLPPVQILFPQQPARAGQSMQRRARGVIGWSLPSPSLCIALLHLHPGCALVDASCERRDDWVLPRPSASSHPNAAASACWSAASCRTMLLRSRVLRAACCALTSDAAWAATSRCWVRDARECTRAIRRDADYGLDAAVSIRGLSRSPDPLRRARALHMAGTRCSFKPPVFGTAPSPHHHGRRPRTKQRQF
jgi:hypothetical protein